MATSESAASNPVVNVPGTAAPAYPAPAAVPMTPAQERMYERRWVALLILSLSLVIVIADSTIVNIAFPSIQKTFGASFADAEWINAIYSLVFGAALITWGKLGDQFGRRNIFIGGAFVFLIGSAGTGFSPSIGFAVFARAMQGMGAAMMSPSTLSIISSTFKGRERAAAFGAWGASAGVAVAFGPIIGGWLIANGGGITTSMSGFFHALSISPDSWRLAFLINLPIALVAIVGSIWAIQESRDNSIRHRIDFLGIFLASLSLGLIVFGAIEGQNYGWLQAKQVFKLGSIVYPQLADGVTKIPAGTASFIPLAFAVGIVGFILFVIYEVVQERRGGEPLFEFGMLRYRSFRYGLLTIMIIALGEFGMVLALSIFFQLAKGLDAFQTGLTFLPFAIVTLIAAPSAGILSSRIGSKWVVTTGMCLEAFAMFLMAHSLYADASFWQVLPAFICYGGGVGLAISQLANITLSDIPPERAGVASGATNTIRQLGSSLGIALIGAILFGLFAEQSKPLIDQRLPAAFAQFGQDVSAANIAPASKTFGKEIASFGDTVRQQIDDGLDANTGFDTSNSNVVQSAIDRMPSAARLLLQVQGVNLHDPAVVQQIKTDLKPYADRLAAVIQASLAEGFSTAARSSATVAMIFIIGGALCSLLIPNNKPRWGDAAPAAAH
ncbi:MAG: MFS transporter [Aggregatilineales bacterium]